jgi:arylsulfatase A-like enzyme
MQIKIHINNKTILAGLVPALFFLDAPPAVAQKEKGNNPNIIFIMADDMGWADAGYQGFRTSGLHETPNIDRLAREGMILDRFYPSAANCAPSRASLLTGMFSPRHGVYIPQGLSRGGDVSRMRWKVPTQDQDPSFNTFHVSINNVDPGFVSLAEMLKAGGYTTARLGKWHIGDDNQGFDLSSADGTPNFVTNLWGLEERYYTDINVAERLTDAAIDFIYNNREKPFFLYLAHWEPHTPLAAKDERIEYYRTKFSGMGNGEVNPVYAAMIEQLDISTGRIMALLEALELDQNTLVIFTSDNGGLNRIPNNYPLRGNKGSFYEGGIRTPCVIRWPGVVEAGSRTDFPVNGVDFMPTFAEIASLPVPDTQPVDGISVLPLLRGEEMKVRHADRTMFFHFPLYLGGQESSLPVYGGGEENYWRAVPSTTMIRGDWKLIYYYEYETYELFNLKEDISEQTDLSAGRPEVARSLLDELNKWTKKVDAPVPVVPNEKFDLHRTVHHNSFGTWFRY